MRTINTVSETIGYTIDTYGQFEPDLWLDDSEAGEYGEDWDFDHTAYVADLANYCAETIERACSFDFVKFKLKATATGSYSPREYNFATDNAELLIEFDDRRVLDYVKRHLPEFRQYLKDTFTSYDGFMSYVPNDWAEFLGQAMGQTGDDIDRDRNWAIMLGWYLRHSEILTLDDYFDAMNDHASEAAYNNVTDVKKGA
jgi:hypothetical protein